MSVVAKTKPKVRKRTPRKTVAQDEAVAWVKKAHPSISVEKNGDWVWLMEPVPATAWKSLAGYGFQRKQRSPGFTKLESGNHGTWSHSCNHPSRHKFSKAKDDKDDSKSKEEPTVEVEQTEAELMAELAELMN